MIIRSNFIPHEMFSKNLLKNYPELENKPISIFYDYPPSSEELLLNPYNILILGEPNQLFGLHNWAIQNSYLFSCILTWGQEVLDQCDNALLFPFGTTFLHENNIYEKLAALDKKFEISFLCGSKNMIEGHKLRQKIYNKQSQVKIPTKWLYTTTESKSICFENNMFHIVVENSKNQNYFTEKIVDAFLTKTLPLYWGCSNIGDFFDDRGIITFSNENELVDIINSLTEEDYFSRKEYIENNYQTAMYYADIFSRMGNVLKDIINLNNI